MLCIKVILLTLQIPLDLIQCLNSIEMVSDLDKCVSTETLLDENPVFAVGSKYVTDTYPKDLTSGNRI
jgi:hypothetical protein